MWMLIRRLISYQPNHQNPIAEIGRSRMVWSSEVVVVVVAGGDGGGDPEFQLGGRLSFRIEVEMEFWWWSMNMKIVIWKT